MQLWKTAQGSSGPSGQGSIFMLVSRLQSPVSELESDPRLASACPWRVESVLRQAKNTFESKKRRHLDFLILSCREKKINFDH